MELFSFDPSDLRDTFTRQGWLHVRNGVTEAFYDHVREYSAQRRAAEALHGTGIRGEKDQYLYDPQGVVDVMPALREVAERLCGLRGERLTLAERHIKHYAPNADPDPVAHKDRLASQMNVGISIDVATGSHLVLYPDDHRGVNPFLTADLRKSLAPDEQPSVVLQGARAVEIHDRPGDVVVFPGGSMWHLRRRSAGTVNLYFKVNDFDCDPLGEDPTTGPRRQQTLAAIDRLGTAALGETPLAVSRQCEWLGRLRGPDGVERPAVKLWDVPTSFVTEAELRFVEQLQAGAVATLQQAASDGSAPAVAELVRLARRGIIDLLVAG